MIDPSRHRRDAIPRGFSLVEVAIVLVIIGLILAAVLQGRQLIASAEYKSLKGQLSEYRNAFYTFRDRYNALPGDFDDANARLGLSGANGDGDGAIENGPGCASAGDESCLAWRHLRAAGMIDGNPNDTGANASPRHTYGGVVASFFTGTAGNGTYGHKIGVEDVPADIGRQLDEDIDDDLCDAGRVAGTAPSGGDCDGSDTSLWPAGSGPINIVHAL